MNFDDILNSWENRQQQPPSETDRREDRSQKNNIDWLEMYPPDADIVAEKDKDRRPAVSEGRSIWLRRPHQDTLDLHGLYGHEAGKELTRFIGSMRRRGLRKGLVIHGKGRHSTHGSVLGPLVRELLEKSSEVGEFGRASRKDGGSGATWFILRQRSR